MYRNCGETALVKREAASVVHARLTPRQQIGMGLPWASGSVALALSAVVLVYGAPAILVLVTAITLVLSRLCSELCLRDRK